MKKFYFKELNKVSKMRKKFNLIPIVLIYLLLTIGINYFVLPYSNSLIQALFNGMLFGLIGYGIYDLTNYVTFEKFSLKTTIIDMIWGSSICGIVSILSKYFIFLIESIM